MTLYQKLFGLQLMKPAGESDGGGSTDRGDNYTPPADTGTETDAGTGTNEDTSEEDLRTATGEGEAGDKEGQSDDQPRDPSGKFAKKDRETAIPKTRFDEAVRRERERADAAERALAEIRQQQQQISRGADISKLEEQVKELRSDANKALIKGDDVAAAELSEKADRLNRQIAIEQARDMTAQAKEAAREEIRWDITVESIEAKYPELNDKSESFDQDLTDDVVDAMNGLMQRERLSRSAALVRAVEKVMSRRVPQETEPKKGLDRGPEKDRKEAAVSKNLDAAARQPASTKKVGADSDKHGQQGALPSPNAMTFEEFDALPESTRAKMRGDFVS